MLLSEHGPDLLLDWLESLDLWHVAAVSIRHQVTSYHHQIR
jgi:hypothetical protein